MKAAHVTHFDASDRKQSERREKDGKDYDELLVKWRWRVVQFSKRDEMSHYYY